MIGPARLSRRTMLRGLGVAVGLPVLEAMLPRTVLAGGSSTWPMRSAFFFIPNGAHMPDWKPKKRGKGFELPPILEPLAGLKDKMNVLTGLTLDGARGHGDGPGDHARSAAAFLTGAHPVKTQGANIRNGKSVDQVAASEVGRHTKFASLEVGVERGLNHGGCDSGYSCAYSNNISWQSESTPAAKETNPRAVFDRLFSSGNSHETEESRLKRLASRKSILDFVLEDAKSLNGQLGQNDRRKLDEYLTAVREVEGRIDHFAKSNGATAPKMDIPESAPDAFADHVSLLGDLIVLAFQTDLTRVATFMIGNEGTNRPYKDLGVSEGHHSLSHHGNDEEKQKQISRINRHHTTLLASILGKLNEIKEGDGTLLDHSMIVYGSGIGDGNAHNHDDLPVLLFGSGGGVIKTGRHLVYPRNTPLCNLYLSMLQILGVQTKSFGDSTRKLTGLLA